MPHEEEGVEQAEQAEQAEQSERDELSAFRERAEKAESERDEYLGDLQRLAADFDNYRKRAARDQENTVLRAGERIAKDLLPILDDLERALAIARQHDVQLAEGIEMTSRNLLSLLEKEGVTEIDASGRFDPHLHEAVASLPADVEEGTVLEVNQKGYSIAGRVLRPARVVIASASLAEEGAKEE